MLRMGSPPLLASDAEILTKYRIKLIIRLLTWSTLQVL